MLDYTNMVSAFLLFDLVFFVVCVFVCICVWQHLMRIKIFCHSTDHSQYLYSSCIIRIWPSIVLSISVVIHSIVHCMCFVHTVFVMAIDIRTSK